MSADLTKGVWHDHETKAGGGTLDLVERETGLQGQERFRWLESNGFLRPSSKPNGVAAEYPYCNENGDLLFQVVRYEPKSFRQRRPNGSGGWTWNLAGVTQVPYRLPELIEAISLSHGVAIVEGEKDVDRLREIGVPATCNATGAGRWKPEHSEWFAGADVVVIGDNDEAGQDHARAVAYACASASACTLRSG